MKNTKSEGENLRVIRKKKRKGKKKLIKMDEKENLTVECLLLQESLSFIVPINSSMNFLNNKVMPKSRLKFVFQSSSWNIEFHVKMF